MKNIFANIVFGYLEVGGDSFWESVKNKTFNDRLFVDIKEEGSEGVAYFYLNILALDSLSPEEGLEEKWVCYLKQALVLKSYNKPFISDQVKLLVKNANNSTEEDKFRYLSYFLEEEAEEWIYDDGLSASRCSKFVGKGWGLKEMWLEQDGKKTTEPSDWEYFNDDVYFTLKDEVTGEQMSFKCNIISLDWLKNELKDKEGLYLQHSIIMKYFGFELIEEILNEKIMYCNSRGPRAYEKCLEYHFTRID